MRLLPVTTEDSMIAYGEAILAVWRRWRSHDKKIGRMSLGELEAALHDQGEMGERGEEQ